MTAAVFVAALVVGTAVAGRRALLASRLGSRRPVRAGSHLPGWAASVAAAVGMPVEAWPAALVAAAVVGLVAGGPALAVLLAGAVAGAPFAARAAVHRRRRRQAAAELPAALEAVARSLRAGAGLHAAIADAPGFEEAAAKTARGAPLTEALAEWQPDVPGARLAVAALSVAADIGGPQAAAVDGVALTLRQRVAARAEAWALGGQARLSAVLIAAAPVAFGLLASAADGQHAAFLLRTPLGLAMLVVGLALDLLGAVWMAKLARLP